MMLELIKREMFKWKYRAQCLDRAYENFGNEIIDLKKQINGRQSESNTLALVKAICATGSYIIKIFDTKDKRIVISIDQQERKSRKFEIDFRLFCADADGYDSSSEQLLVSVNYGRAIIRDLQTSRNEGHGSLFIKALIEFCYKNEIRWVLGRLSPIDMNDTSDPAHKNRLLHFYSKFGFAISDIPASDWKRIILDLDAQ